MPVAPSLISTFLKTRRTLDTEETTKLFEDFVLNDITQTSSVRDLFMAMIVLWGEQRITSAQVEQFQTNFLAALQKQRQIAYPDLASAPLCAVDVDNPARFTIYEANKDTSVGHLAGLFAPSQEERFVRNVFAPLALEYHHDHLLNPAAHATGLKKMMLKGIVALAHKTSSDPDVLLNTLLSSTSLTWVDDGKSTNPAMDAFLDRKSTRKTILAV